MSELREDAGAAAVRKRAARLSLLALLALFVAAALLRVAESALGLSPALDRGHHSLSYSPVGFRAIHDVIGKLGFKVERLTKSYASLPQPSESVLLVLDPSAIGPELRGENFQLASEYARRVRQWVEAGGRLVVALPGRTLASIGSIELVSSEDLGGTAKGLQAVDSMRAFREALAGLPDTSPASLPARLHGYGALEGFDAAFPGLEEPRSKALDTYLAPDSKGEVPVFTSGDGFDPLITLAERPLAVEKRLGDGAVAAVSTAMLFANSALLDTPAAEAVARLIDHASDGGKRVVWFDEYTHGFADRGGMLRWVWSTALLFPVASVLVAILAAAWRGAVPPGPPLPSRSPPRRAKEEFVLSMADLHRRAGHGRHALRAVAEAYDARIGALLGSDGPAAGLARQPAEPGTGRFQPPPSLQGEEAVLRAGARLHGEYLKAREAVRKNLKPSTRTRQEDVRHPENV